MRGAGGNFGIVTEFEFALHPVGPNVVAGPVFWPIEESPRVLRFYRDWIAEAPDELMTIVIHRRAPAVPWLPAELHGRHVVAVAGCHAGPESKRTSLNSLYANIPVCLFCFKKNTRKYALLEKKARYSTTQPGIALR